MTENWLLNWAVMAISLFNTVLLLWLGLTVLLNAENRTWGLWLAGGVILLGGGFFLVHTIILGQDYAALGSSIDFWWRVGWVPVVTIPYIWYVVILWYSGFWDPQGSKLNRRHYPWFVITSMLVVFIILLLVFANPLPSIIQVAQLSLNATPSIRGIPLLILIYPFYILLCISLSVDVLRNPAPSGRIMGNLARRRARPWLIAAAVTQIVVSLLVGWVMFWVVDHARDPVYQVGMDTTIASFDLVIATLIACASIFLGQAVTSYEVFTGKSLPRYGLLRYWRRAVFLAGGYAVVISYSLTRGFDPIYSVLLSVTLMTVFFALLSWRSLNERQTYIKQLRPFLSSHHAYDQFLSTSPQEIEVQGPFQSLCQGVLSTQLAYLAAHGPLAPLVGEPLTFPMGQIPSPPDLDEIIGPWISPQDICIPLPQGNQAEWQWLVPLWSERGLSGILLLGPKIGGGLYSQEEIEIARNIGERLIDIRASAEMTQRLMALQRQRLAESQVIDRRTRRVLHDEVLPQIHTALLSLDDANTKNSEAIETLTSAHSQISNLLRELPAVTAPEVSRLGLVPALRKTITNEFSESFSQVDWDITEEAQVLIKDFSNMVSEVVYFAAREAVRNAARYGHKGNRLPSLTIAAHIRGEQLDLIIENTAIGEIDLNETDIHSGQGLALHGTLLAVIGGELNFDRISDQRARVILSVPKVSPYTPKR